MIGEVASAEELRSIEEAHAPAVARGARCIECPLYGQKAGPVMGEIFPGAKLLVVGEAPGENEVKSGKPFHGASGGILEDALEQGGLQRSQWKSPYYPPTGEVSVTNTILCMPPVFFDDYLARVKYEGKQSPVDCCSVRLRRDMVEHLRPYLAGTAPAPGLIAELPTATIAPVGSLALGGVCDALGIPVGHSRKILPGEVRSGTIGKQHGAPILVPAKVNAEGRAIRPPITLVPSYHPAFAMRAEKEMMPVIVGDLARSARVAKRGGKIDWREAKPWLNPGPETAINIMERMRLSGAQITVDIETDGVSTRHCQIRCVGLGAVIDGEELVVVVPIRKISGALWWKPDVLRPVARALLTLLDHCKLAGQTLAFDTEILLRLGLMTDREKNWFDDAVAHHDTDQSELQHDLGFMGARYFETPRHKEDADASVIDGVSDHDLHAYCAKDVVLEMRLATVLDKRISECGTRTQFEVDTELLPIMREMGCLGLPMNHAKRVSMYRELEVERARKVKLLGELVGKHPKRRDGTWGPEPVPSKKTGKLPRSWEPTSFNPNSVPQIKEWRFDLCGLVPILNTDDKPYDPTDPIQDPSTGEDAINAILERGVDPKLGAGLDALIEYRGVDKIIGTNVCLREVSAEMAKKLLEAGERVHLDCGTWLHERGKIAENIEWEDGGIWGVTGLQPVLYTRWSLHPVVSGRWSAQPAVMNWSERVVILCPTCFGAAKGKPCGCKTKGFCGCPRCHDPAEGVCKGKATLNTRSMIEAPPGHVFIGADMEQVELRMYAVDAGDRLLLDAFAKDMDAHAWNFAAMIADGNPHEQKVAYDKMMVLGKKHPRVKEARNTAKRFVYLILYGGEEEKLFQTMSSERLPDGTKAFPGIRPDEVSRWFRNWHGSHPETREWQAGAVRQWQHHGFVSTRIHGRKRFFLGGVDRNAMGNHRIQGSAADMMNNSAKELWHRLPPRRHSRISGLRLQVHDYLGGIWPEKDVDGVRKHFEQVMPCVLDGMKFPIEVKVSQSWGGQ